MKSLVLLILLLCGLVCYLSFKSIPNSIRGELATLLRKSRLATWAATVSLLSLCALVGGLAGAIGWVMAPRNERWPLPEEVAAILDNVVESKIILRDEAIVLNDWLNDSSRPTRRTLETELTTVSSDLPFDAMNKIGNLRTEIDDQDRLNIYRFLAQSCSAGESHGEYGESLEPPSSIRIPDDVYETLLLAANGQPITVRHRFLIANVLEHENFECQFLSPPPPDRDPASEIFLEPPASEGPPPMEEAAPPAPEESASAWLRPEENRMQNNVHQRF